MNLTELTEKYIALVADSDLFTVKSIEHINHRPHRFTVGPKHIEASNGLLTEAVMRACGCAHPECKVPYDEHTYETAIFLALKRDGTVAEATPYLKTLADKLEEDKIDGLALVETPEKFRIK